LDDDTNTGELIGREVVLATLPTQWGQPLVGTHGFVTGVAQRTVPNPIQITFQDADRTVRYYSNTQFAAFFSLLGSVDEAPVPSRS
jgi:hypothetical protein